MEIDIKKLIAIATLIFGFAGFYYTTINDLNYLSLQIEALITENRMQQGRLDTIDKKINRINKKIRNTN